MDLRLGLSLLLLLIYLSSTQSKNIRDGPNLRQRHAKRATLSEFLQPPPPIGNNLRNHPPRGLEPPPPPLSPSSIRTGRYVTDPRPEDIPSRGYFSRLLGWLNPWSSNGGLEPPPQSFSRNPVHQEQPPSLNQKDPFQNDRNCNPCNDVPWIPIRGLVDGPIVRHPQNLNGYYQQTPSQEIREPHFAYPSQNIYPGPMTGNHPIPNPHIYPGAVPPLYKAEPFGNEGSLPGHDFHHRQETNNYGPLDSGSASTNIQENVQVQGQRIQVESNQQQSSKSVPEQNQNQGIQQQINQNQGIQGQAVEKQQNQGYQSENQQFHTESEVVPSVGGQISSEKIHFEKSPLIDLTVSSTPAAPVTLTQSFSTLSSSRNIPEASTRPSSLIDYLVSGFDQRIPATGAAGTGQIVPTGTEQIGTPGIGSVEASVPDVINQGQGLREENYGPSGYNEKQPFLEALMESYYNFKKEEAALEDAKESASNSASSGTSGEDLIPATPSSRAVKRNKQVQIIIPYTSQYTPIPFHSSFVDDRNGRVMGHYLPRKVPSGNQFNYSDDDAVGHESRTVAVTSLPDVSSSIAPSEKGKKNSIDVQRLQKNIDNWTIQEYSSGVKPSTAQPNTTRHYLSHSKKIPDAYFTTVEPKNTFEISRVTQNTTPKTTTTAAEAETPLIDAETKENGTGIGIYSSASENYTFRIQPVFSTVSTIYDSNVNSTEVSIGQKESRKAVAKESRKKPKKKDPEQVERAYQVLPQAVNNLAVASTGPEQSIIQLWGIMEHEDFASQKSEKDLPTLYTGHSKVSYSNP